MITYGELKQVALAAKELIKDPKLWVKGSWTLTAEGKPTTLCGKDAHCFCLGGSLLRARFNLKGYPINMEDFLEELSLLLGFSGGFGALAAKNDFKDTTHDEVLSILDEIVAKCEGQHSDNVFSK